MYSKQIRELVVYQKKLGWTYAEISKSLNLSIRTVKSLATYIPKFHRHKIGPKMLINNHLARRIRRFILKENNLGNKVNCNTIIRNLNLSVSRRTVNNHLLRKDFKYKKHVRKIILSKYHKLRRVILIKSWIEKNIDWANIIFTDEKKFKLDGPDNW